MMAGVRRKTKPEELPVKIRELSPSELLGRPLNRIDEEVCT